MECSNASLLPSDLWSSQQSEPRQFRFVTIRHNQFSISHFIHKIWAPCFVISIEKVNVFMSHDATGFLLARNL